MMLSSSSREKLRLSQNTPQPSVAASRSDVAASQSSRNVSRDNPQSSHSETDVSSLSHDQFRTMFSSELKSLVESDAVLSDLDIDNLSAEDMENLIALHYGDGMHLKILRGDDTYLRVVIRRDATLLQLRKQIKIKTIRELKANEKTETNKRKTDSKTRTFRSSPDRISWKSVWKTYGLKCDGEILRDLEVRLIDVGVRNGTTLTFVKLKGK